ncbi:hypothetical protein AB4Y43_16645 [Paraburkholderia sp. BR10872]|uniref:hypothetical protein n=1 Tax=Paraburkholderia sp. BR10872 TaxID=3236989 RepID=UPI0034D1630F
MQHQQPEAQAQAALLDFDTFADVLCGIAIRTGITHQLDRILMEARTPAERVVNVARALTEVAATDPGVSRVLDRLDAMTILRNEVITRLGKGRPQP